MPQIKSPSTGGSANRPSTRRSIFSIRLGIRADLFGCVSQAQPFQLFSREAMLQRLRQVLADVHRVVGVVFRLEDHLTAIEANYFAADHGLALAIADPERVESRFGTQACRGAIVAIVEKRFARPLAVVGDVGEMDKAGDLPQVGTFHDGRSEEDVPLGDGGVLARRLGQDTGPKPSGWTRRPDQ